jgi:hypothetical protein
MKFYRLTTSGLRQLTRKESNWEQPGHRARAEAHRRMKYIPGGEFLEYESQARSFTEVIGGRGDQVLYTTPDGTERFAAGLTTANTFSFMGVSALVGRTFTPEDRGPARPS